MGEHYKVDVEETEATETDESETDDTERVGNDLGTLVLKKQRASTASLRASSSLASSISTAANDAALLSIDGERLFLLPLLSVGVKCRTKTLLVNCKASSEEATR